MMKLSIIGTGYVGLVTGTCFAELGNDVLCVDSNPEKIRRLRDGRSPIYEPGLEPMIRRNAAAGRLKFSGSAEEAAGHGEVVFIAVNTPSRPDGSADLADVEAVARQIASCLPGAYRIVVEKSTVPVRTGEKVRETIRRYCRGDADFDVASNPEFLREGSAIEDFMKPDRVVLGVGSARPVPVLRALYEPLGCPILVTDINSAELIKHASNSFLAAKISFINAVARVCELCGADVRKVAEGMGMDRRIGRDFLQAGIGYGGSCFPKDVAAFTRIAADLGYSFELLQAVEKINREQHLWPVQAARKALWVLGGKRIGILGLAFKPDTDDMRNAPSVAIIEELIREGAHVRAHDPCAGDQVRALFPDVELVDDPRKVADDADAVILVTEWAQYQDLDPAELRERMAFPLFIDGRNMFQPETMQAMGFTYRSVGRTAS